METIRELLLFVNTRLTDSDPLKHSRSVIGEYALRGVALNILDWMKSQHRMSRMRPLRLKNGATWCHDLKTLMTEDATFKNVFEINDDKMDFKEEINIQQRERLCELVDREYTPRLMT